MDKYYEANKKLAKLLGWTKLSNAASAGYPEPWLRGKPPMSDGYFDSVPDWSGENAAAFALMVEYSCYPKDDVLNTGTPVVIVDWIVPNKCFNHVIEIVADHPSKEAAVRYAIVQAVIAKLEVEHG